MSLRDVFKEQGRNFPKVLGFMNKPYHIIREGGIADQAMAAVRGETPVHLAQKLLGQSHLTGPSQLPSRLSIDKFLPQANNRPTPIKDILVKRGLLHQQVERNIPRAYERPGSWPIGANIARLPSVHGINTGPKRTVHPQISVIT